MENELEIRSREGIRKMVNIDTTSSHVAVFTMDDLELGKIYISLLFLLV